MFVKPANPDLKVRDPERGNHLPAAGDTVPDTEYWRRRLDDGDVVEAPMVEARAARTAPVKDKE